MQTPEPTPESPRDGVRVGPTVTVPAWAMAFTYSSSSGPGGQNVNKRATKCLLRVALAGLPLTGAQMARLREAVRNDVTAEGELLITSDEHRSQIRNRDECIDKLVAMVRASLAPPKVRRATRPSRGSKERRLKEKKVRGERKKGRQDGTW